MPEPPITTTATIIEIIARGRLYQARAKNGLVIPAHISREARDAGEKPDLNIGDQVGLEFTPYDFSKARIARTPTARIEGR